jgi:hypothetical protein
MMTENFTMLSFWQSTAASLVFILPARYSDEAVLQSLSVPRLILEEKRYMLRANTFKYGVVQFNGWRKINGNWPYIFTRNGAIFI